MRENDNMDKQKKQVVTLYGASLIGMLFGVCNSVINTHALSPADYGDVRYVQNIITFISTILLLGYFASGSRLLAISKDEAKSRSIRGCLIEILGILVLITIGLMFVLYGLHDFFKPFPGKTLFLVSIPVCAMPLLLNYINTTSQGDNQIGRIALARLLPSFLYLSIAYFLYKQIHVTSTIMVLLQWGIGTTVLLGIVLSSGLSFKNTKEAYQSLKKENSSYGIQLYYGSLAMVATQYIGGITLGLFNMDNSVVGFYTLALTVTTPLQMVPSIIGTTYFKKFAQETKIPRSVFRNSLLITIGTNVIFVLCIYPIVTLLYSKEYADVGLYAMLLSVGFSLHGFGDFINRYLGSHGQGRSIRNSSFACGFMLIIGNTLLAYLCGVYGAIMTKILSSLFYVLTLLYYYIKFTKAHE